MPDVPAQATAMRDKLIDRGCRLYHAIDLPDFETYAENWALLSRQQLAAGRGIKTTFYTDGSDKERGLFDRCFGNLSYFWKFFWRWEGVPNAYGLITLVFRTEAFRHCDDVAVTADGANAKDFDLARDWFTEPSVLNWLIDDNGEANEFLEFSTKTSRMPFDLLDEVIVQPVEAAGTTLAEVVCTLLADNANDRKVPPVRVEPLAKGRDEQRVRLATLLAWTIERKGVPGDPEKTLPEELRAWHGNAKGRGALFPWCPRAYDTLSAIEEFAKARAAPGG